MTKRLALTGLLTATLMCAAAPADRLVIQGKNGPGKGKRIVLVSGDEEYRSEQALPQLAKILSQHHGFDWEEVRNAIEEEQEDGRLRGASTLFVLGSLFLVGTQTVSTALPRIVAILLDTRQMGRLRVESQLMQQAIEEPGVPRVGDIKIAAGIHKQPRRVRDGAASRGSSSRSVETTTMCGHTRHF
jgi:hypothetical protein